MLEIKLYSAILHRQQEVHRPQSGKKV